MNRPNAIGGLVHHLYATNIRMKIAQQMEMKSDGSVRRLMKCFTAVGGKVKPSVAASKSKVILKSLTQRDALTVSPVERCAWLPCTLPSFLPAAPSDY